MGNSCKCIPKFDSKINSRVGQLSAISPKKKARKSLALWENVLNSYSAYEFPLEIFKISQQAKFKQLLFDGPPSNLRWDAWKAAFTLSIRSITFDASDQIESLSIDKDIDRTFPNHPFFKIVDNQISLRNVLVSMVNNYPELGYCQGMNSVAGILLIESNGNQLETYALFECICIAMGGRSLFEYGFPLVVQLCEEFHKALIENLPVIHDFFVEIELDDNLWLTKWFMTLFSYSFHYDCVVRIWDAILAHGLGFMVNIALGLVSYIKHDLLGKSLADMLEYLPELKDMYVDVDVVLFHGSRFRVRQIQVEVELEQGGVEETVQEEILCEEPILTKWRPGDSMHRQSLSVMEEFAVSSNNTSKFSV